MIGCYAPPSGQKIDLHHVYCNSEAPVRFIPQHNMITVEPWSGFANVAKWLPSLAQDDPVYLRYAHEFNGTWYPWCNRHPDALIAEWKLIAKIKPANVKLIWCPNVDFPGSHAIDPFFPGDDVFDSVGLDGYNRLQGASDQSFSQVFGPSLDHLRKLSTKPILICETATPRRKAHQHDVTQSRWIEQMWACVAKQPDIVGVVWFNQDKAGDEWALGPAGMKAFFGGK